MVLVLGHRDNAGFYVKVREYHCTICVKCILFVLKYTCLTRYVSLLRHFGIHVLFILYIY